MEGWIKVHRCLMKKAIWKDSTPEQKVILVTLLMMANHQENEWEWKGNKFTAKPGQFVTSLPSIVKKCGRGITTMKVRTALSRFERFEFLTCESTNSNRLVTITNWDTYQLFNEDDNRQDSRPVTAGQQTSNSRLTSNKNANNDKNEKKYKKEVFEKVLSEVFSDEQYIEELQSINRGVDLKAAFKECYLHHIQSENPPVEIWQWRQKLNSWKKKANGFRKSNQYQKGQFVQ